MPKKGKRSCIALDRAIVYSFYFLFSVGTGFVSTLGETDYVANLSQSVLPVLIALLILNTTVSSLLFNQLLKTAEEGMEIGGVINAMKQNVRTEVIILLFTFVLLSFRPWLLIVLPKLFPLSIICNSVVVFALIYFVHVVYDSTMGLYKLYAHITKKEENTDAEKN